MIRGKKAEEVLYPVVIFVILNLIFFSLLMVFVTNSSNGSLVYEQAYAKQIALLIDKAEDSTTISINFEKGIEIAKKNKITSTENLVQIRNSEVIVKLSDSGGYSIKYFSDNDVTVSFDGNNLIIKTTEKIEN